MPRTTTTTSKRSHVCAACQKAFTTSGHLQRHSKVHTGEKKHKCPFPGCQTSCSRQDNLQQHYRIHLSPGSRRSPSTLLTKQQQPVQSTISNRGSSTQIAPLTPPSHTSSLSEYIPCTVVDGPPVLRLPADISTAMILPSPPNTPPPLVPASPRVALQQLSKQVFGTRRHSTGTVYLDGDHSTWRNDESLHPIRPSSSSSSSSSSSCSVPHYDLFGGMTSHDDREGDAPEQGFPRPLFTMNDMDYSHEQIVMDTSDLYVSTTPVTQAKDHSFSFDSESTSTDRYFSYTSPAVSASTFQYPSQAPDCSISVYQPSAKMHDALSMEYMVTPQSHDNENLLMNDHRSYTFPRFLQSQQTHSFPYPNQFTQSNVLSHHTQADHLGYNSNAPNPQILHNAGSNLDYGWELW